jgi:hypothetical protein
VTGHRPGLRNKTVRLAAGSRCPPQRGERGDAASGFPASGWGRAVATVSGRRPGGCWRMARAGAGGVVQAGPPRRTPTPTSGSSARRCCPASPPATWTATTAPTCCAATSTAKWSSPPSCCSTPWSRCAPSPARTTRPPTCRRGRGSAGPLRPALGPLPDAAATAHALRRPGPQTVGCCAVCGAWFTDRETTVPARPGCIRPSAGRSGAAASRRRRAAGAGGRVGTVPVPSAGWPGRPADGSWPAPDG